MSDPNTPEPQPDEPDTPPVPEREGDERTWQEERHEQTYGDTPPA